MKKENTIIEVSENNNIVGNPYDKMLEMALNSDIGLEKLEKLLELKERYEDNEARKAYHKAMAKFKANPPEIEKDANVSYKQTSYNHATLGNVTTKINKSLAIHGLSASWKTEQKEGQIKVTCTITHMYGFSESTSLTAMPDTSGSKNSIQAIGSTTTYLQRYTILALTGLATKEQDNDGVVIDNEKITENQVSQLTDMILAINKSVDDYCSYLKVNDLSEIPMNLFGRCVSELAPMEG